LSRAERETDQNVGKKNNKEGHWYVVEINVAEMKATVREGTGADGGWGGLSQRECMRPQLLQKRQPVSRMSKQPGVQQWTTSVSGGRSRGPEKTNSTVNGQLRTGKETQRHLLFLTRGEATAYRLWLGPCALDSAQTKVLPRVCTSHIRLLARRAHLVGPTREPCPARTRTPRRLFAGPAGVVLVCCGLAYHLSRLLHTLSFHLGFLRGPVRHAGGLRGQYFGVLCQQVDGGVQKIAAHRRLACG